MKHEDVKVVMRNGILEKQWRLFYNPVRILTANTPEDVLPTLYAVQKAVNEGFHAAGFLSYEAAPGLDNACQTHALRGLPLVWFGLFRGVEDIQKQNVGAIKLSTERGAPPAFAKATAGRRGQAVDFFRLIGGQTQGADPIPRRPLRLTNFNVGEWEPSISAEDYEKAIDQIKKYLKNGDTYQVNYSLRLRAQFNGDPWSLFSHLHRTQRAKYSAFIDTDDFTVCSASPELFFSLDGEKLVSRPMKGTSARGLTFDQDSELADILQRSEKNRAENVMIVDMVRNDMGRIADPGSVYVSRLFEIERYPTVFQMTSTVECRTSATFPDILKALFPCASITGAPKIRTMQIIKELEPGPRGIYTGCIGYVSPGRKARFNVAIRTVCVDKQEGTAEYGVGGGVVWDSDAENEYEECRVKAAVLMSEAPDFELLESILWEQEKGYFLLGRHLDRLKRSAEYFGFVIDMDEIKGRLTQEADSMRATEKVADQLLSGRRNVQHPTSNAEHRSRIKDEYDDDTLLRSPLTINHQPLTIPYKVRLRVDEEGKVSVEREPLDTARMKPWIVALAAHPIDSRSPFLYHKTTNRTVYDRAKLSVAGYDDVLLWNERGEITESTVANIVVEKDGKRVTPPVKCGLLPGVFREWLLDRGEIGEGIITVEEIRNAERVFLINSVRKWIPAMVKIPAMH